MFVTQQMKETNALKVNKFGRKYKDWVEVVRKSNNIKEQNKTKQNTYY